MGGPLGADPEKPVANRRTGAPRLPSPGGHRLPEALLISLVLHAVLLSLQFGVLGDGLPWFGNPFDARRANVPDLYAILQAPAPPPVSTPEPPVSTGATVTRIVPVGMRPVGRQPALVPGIAPVRRTPVLATAEESTWLAPPPEDRPEPMNDETPATSEPAPPVDTEEKAANDQAALAREREEALERQHREEPARIAEEERQAELAAAQARRNTEERRRAEDLLRAEAEKQQTERAAAQARQEAEERKRVESMARAEAERRLAEQVAAKATADALTREAAAEASRRAQQAQANALAAAANGSAAQAAMGGANSTASTTRPAEAADKGLQAMTAKSAAEPSRQRRGSIVGRDPRDIQLVFYGEGWRQKIERLGSVNYPKLARNRIYDTLVATISINSDGTLAAVHVGRSSGYRDFDAAVLRVVELAAPFATFPPALKNHYDVIDLTGTWVFLEDRPRMLSE